MPAIECPSDFLSEYWQKKPCLLRQALPAFSPLLDGDDLAGLATDEMAEARLVKGCQEALDWEITHGPFTAADFANLPEHNWTLLVQDVEKHYAPLQALMQHFSFIPNWRLDDLMISYAVSGGSVGPHVDQYDVFLLQAAGTRRWQIATTFEPELLADCPLNILQHFDAEQTWVLEPGDILYLPPNVAHYGVTLEPGMTWSIGSRAPSAADLLQGFGEWLAFDEDQGGRYTDPGLQAAKRAGEIEAQALQDLRQLMQAKLNDRDFSNAFLAAFLSRFRLAHEPAAPPAPVRTDAVFAALSADQTLMRNPWTRLTWIATPTGASLFAAGAHYACPPWLAEILCGQEQPRISAKRLSPAVLETLAQLINTGHFLLLPGA